MNSNIIFLKITGFISITIMVKIEINILLLSNKNFQNIIKYNQSNKEEWLPSSLLLLLYI